MTGGDVVSLGLLGLRGRPLRSMLSCLGVAIGIACVVAVLGVSASSQAGLLRQIDALGTNLLTVRAGQNVFGDTAKLPVQAPAMISRLPGVEQVAHVGKVPGPVFRNDHIPSTGTGGIAILAASPDLARTLQAPLAAGTWFTEATERFPVTVLGAAAARRLGISQPGRLVYLDGQWFTVIGLLGSVVLDQTIDSAALVGYPAARSLLGFDGAPTTIYERSSPDTVAGLMPRLAFVAGPADPGAVQISRPSDVLVARSAIQSAYNGLFLGLGGVALLVGMIGIANTMVIGVLERRGEIGLRRALGATRAHIRGQFLTESVLLSAIGGVVGVLLGAIVTLGYALSRDATLVVPVAAIATGLAASLVAGTLAGIYPATRAARLSPTEALRAMG